MKRRRRNGESDIDREKERAHIYVYRENIVKYYSSTETNLSKLVKLELLFFLYVSIYVLILL